MLLAIFEPLIGAQEHVAESSRAGHGIALGVDQSAKTKTALEYFSARLKEEALVG
jgi:hypothetical protein